MQKCKLEVYKVTHGWTSGKSQIKDSKYALYLLYV